MPVAGEPLLIDIDPLEDADGNLITDGAAFLFADIVFTAPGSTTATPVTPTAFTHLGSGRYRATIASGSTGRYSGRVRYVRSGVPVQSWTWAEDVIAVAGIAVESPVIAATGKHVITINQGDDYLSADGRAIQIIASGAPNLGTATGRRFRIANSRGAVAILEATWSVSGAYPGDQTCIIELTDAQTATLDVGRYVYDLEATLANTSVVTVDHGVVIVTRDVFPVP